MERLFPTYNSYQSRYVLQTRAYGLATSSYLPSSKLKSFRILWLRSLTYVTPVLDVEIQSLSFPLLISSMLYNCLQNIIQSQYYSRTKTKFDQTFGPPEYFFKQVICVLKVPVSLTYFLFFFVFNHSMLAFISFVVLLRDLYNFGRLLSFLVCLLLSKEIVINQQKARRHQVNRNILDVRFCYALFFRALLVWTSYKAQLLRIVWSLTLP